MTLMYKTLGAYSWIGMFKEPADYKECSVTSAPLPSTESENSFESIAKSAQEFNLALDNLKTVSFV